MADFEYTREDDTLVGTSGDDLIKVVDDLRSGHTGLIDGGDGLDVLESAGVVWIDQLEVDNVERLQISHVHMTIAQLSDFDELRVDRLYLTGPGGSLDQAGQYQGRISTADATALTSRLNFHSDFLTHTRSFDLLGTRFNDTLISTSVAHFDGRGGNDFIQVDGAGALHGGAGRDTLIGGVGGDTLSGGWGDDSMAGGAGDDLYVVDSAADVVVENADEGIDTVRSSISTALGDNVENLTLTGGKWRWGDGNALDNAITGNFNRNVLSGKDGDDTLNGRGGADTLWGGAGDDRFVFDTTLNGRNVDTIKDFGNGNDVIVLGTNVFTVLDDHLSEGGALDVSAFEAGNGVARSADARILYNTATGALLYDGDGSGSGGAVQFALLQPNLTLTADDFVVV